MAWSGASDISLRDAYPQPQPQPQLYPQLRVVFLTSHWVVLDGQDHHQEFALATGNGSPTHAASTSGRNMFAGRAGRVGRVCRVMLQECLCPA